MLSLLLSGCESLINSQVFFPQRRLEAAPSDYGLAWRDIELRTQDGLDLHAWHIPAQGSRVLLLYSHGNAGNISHRLDRIARFNRIGISVLIYDYRGFGQSQGSPSEQGLYLDAQTAFDQARVLADGGGQKLVLLGRSLGGAAAVWLASRRPVDGVILESAFTNLGAMARAVYPLPGLESWLGSRFDSLSRMAQIKAPLLVIHGLRDSLVPPEMGRRLHDAAPGPKDLYLIPQADHNDTYYVAGPAYFDRVTAFLQSLL